MHIYLNQIILGIEMYMHVVQYTLILHCSMYMLFNVHCSVYMYIV